MDVSALAGSSEEKPWRLRSGGGLFLSRSPLRSRENRPVSMASAPPFGASLDSRERPPLLPLRAQTSIHRARINAVSMPMRPMKKTLKVAKVRDINRTPSPGWEFRPPIPHAPSAGVTRVVRRGVPAFPGARDDRDTPLVQEDLYLTDARPPILRGTKPYHQCSVCWNVKSHPVSYGCGHSDCYVCIRMWLEKSWKCPYCYQKICAEPIEHEGELASIANDYPQWSDHSKVNISWEGLEFPRRRKRVIYGEFGYA